MFELNNFFAIKLNNGLPRYLFKKGMAFSIPPLNLLPTTKSYPSSNFLINKGISRKI